MRAISLGWGVQSFTLAAMVALGELDPVDVAIHADTTHERQGTYEFSKRWIPWLESHGVRVVTVMDADQAAAVTSGKTDIPAFTYAENVERIVLEYDDRDQVIGQHTALRNVNGMLRRQCTNRWKIAPMRRWLQENRHGDPVEQWIGISIDEAERMRPSDVKYITHRWPLIERRLSREACVGWLRSHDLEIPVKSSCVFCPYHSRRAWFDMKQQGGQDWDRAVVVDEAIRKVRPPFDLFVHPDRIPLKEIMSPQDNGQIELWAEECSGTCFV